MQRRILGSLFLASFALNFLILLVNITPNHLHVFSGEEPRIAWSIATGQGFSSPFWNLTGPTAWSPPLQPYLMSAVFRGWGISVISESLVQTINIVFFAATSALLALLGAQLFGPSIGLVAGWAWVFIPPAISLLNPFFGNLPFRTTWHFLWDASLATLLLTSLLLVTVRIVGKGSIGPYFLYGALWGLASLANPAVLAVLPISFYFVVQPFVTHRRRVAFIVAGIAAGFLLTCSPWLIRNYVVFQHPVFIRSNFGVEFRVGNVPVGDGTWDSSNEPSFNATEWHRFQSLGEVNYSSLCLREALHGIENSPARFVSVSLLRVRHFWFGPPVGSKMFPALALIKHLPFTLASILAFAGASLMVYRRIRFGWLFLWMLILFPLICYVTFFEQRFRDLIEPELLLLAVFFVHSLIPSSATGGGPTKELDM